eukprot:TRINITY_DN27345_c0_g1_i1.p1 TRINITY_DN27345_c0_g1~~TRINITY_DN27345_c0_g1_i1.p1  ORF type:complete len:728 (+),score=146.69 TRINITY_DN27345_c0_g1_i1:116-2299(+)
MAAALSALDYKHLVDQVRDASQLPPDQRTDEMVAKILMFAQDVSFFKQLPELEQRSLCKVMTYEAFATKQNVCKVGDEGDKFYIILTGAVQVLTPVPGAPCPEEKHGKDELCTCPGRQMQPSAYLTETHGFGDLALTSDKVLPRAATVAAVEDSELLVIRRADYQEFAGQMHRKFLADRLNFLKKCPRIVQAMHLAEATAQDLAIMAQCLEARSLGGFSLACMQGEPAESVFFVRSGQLVQVRTVCVGADLAAENENSSDDDGVTDIKRALQRRKVKEARLVIEKTQSADLSLFENGQEAHDSPKKQKPLKKMLMVGRLGPDTCYGFKQVFTGEKYPVSLVADTFAEIFVMSKQDVLRKFNKMISNALYEVSKDVEISDKWLLQMRRQTDRWDAFKQKTMEQAFAEHHGKNLVAASSAEYAGHFREDSEKKRRLEHEMLTYLGVRREGTEPPEPVWHGPRPHVNLSMPEAEHFSDLPAQKLRPVRDMRKDPQLRKALKQQGYHALHHEVQQCIEEPPSALQIGANATSSQPLRKKNGEVHWDPSIFLLKHWLSLSKDQIGMDDIDNVLHEIDPETAEAIKDEDGERRRTRQPEATSGSEVQDRKRGTIRSSSVRSPTAAAPALKDQPAPPPKQSLVSRKRDMSGRHNKTLQALVTPRRPPMRPNMSPRPPEGAPAPGCLTERSASRVSGPQITCRVWISEADLSLQGQNDYTAHDRGRTKLPCLVPR